MTALIEVHGAREVYFDDDDFSFDPRHVRAFLAEIERRGVDIAWSAMCDAVHLDEPLIERMAAAGCIGIKFGVESASPKVLESVGKPVDPAHIKRVVSWCARVGIKTHAAFMVGLPGEGPAEYAETEDFVRSLGCDTVQVSEAAALQGTRLGSEQTGVVDGKSGQRRKRLMRAFLASSLLSPRWILRQIRWHSRSMASEGIRSTVSRIFSVLRDELGSHHDAIVAVHDRVFPLGGGGAVRTLAIAEELSRRAERVLVVAPSDSERVRGVAVRPLVDPHQSRPRLLGAVWYALQLLWTDLRAGTARLAVAHNSIAAAPMALVGLFRERRFLIDVTDLHAEYLYAPHTSWIEQLLRPLLSWLELSVLSCADELVVVTEVMKRHLVARGLPEGSIRVVHDASDPVKEASELAPRRGIVHLGAIDRQRAVDLLIRAAAPLLLEDPDLRLTLIGDGPGRKAAETLASELGVRHRCEFTGAISHKEAKTRLLSAAIGVIPRPDLPGNRLVTTLKLPEYQAHGVAVVAARLPGIVEAASGSARYFEPGDACSLRHGLEALLEDPEEVTRLARLGLDRAGPDWAETAASILEPRLDPSPVPTMEEDVLVS